MQQKVGRHIAAQIDMWSFIVLPKMYIHTYTYVYVCIRMYLYTYTYVYVHMQQKVVLLDSLLQEKYAWSKG
jgi:hypothetical protein